MIPIGNHVEPGATECDVLIVGGGPSGATTARLLAESGFKVVVLEQGGWVSRSDLPGEKPERDLLAAGSWAWDPNVRRNPWDYPIDVSQSDIHPMNFNGVGGSSVFFGAEWPRLLPSDFRLHSLYGVADDWPMTYEDLQPYYELMDELLGISGRPGDPAYPPTPEPPQRGIPIGRLGRKAAEGMNALGYHWWPGTHAIVTQSHGDRGACARRGTCLWGCPEGAKSSFDVAMWPAALAAGVRLVTQARVREITTHANGLATGAIWIDENGTEHHTTSPVVVVCANGVGTPRLLQLSASSRFPNGLANSSGLVGRRLMLHPFVSVLGIYDEPLESWVGPIGQAIYSLQFAETDFSRGFARGAKWTAMPIPGPMEMLGRFAALPLEQRVGAAGMDLVQRTLGRAFEWGASIEDLPEEANRVVLSDNITDGSGIPAPAMIYTLSDDSRRSLAWQAERMTEAHLAAGAVETRVVDWMPNVGWHMLGTARCGDDAQTSVVDGFGRSHDVPNLFIIDGSVFVTSSAVNPTSTLTAFAARAVAHMIDHAHNQEVPA